MEHAKPQGLPKTEARREIGRQNGCPQGFYGQAPEDHRPLEPDHPLHIVEAQGLGHDHTLLQADAPAQQEHKQSRHGHEAQAPHLDEAQQHTLAEAGPLGIGIKGGQSRNAGGRGSRKQRPEEVAALAVPGGNRQSQQKRSRQDQDQKGHGNDLRRAQRSAPPLHGPGHQLISQ